MRNSNLDNMSKSWCAYTYYKFAPFPDTLKRAAVATEHKLALLADTIIICTKDVCHVSLGRVPGIPGSIVKVPGAS